MLFIASNRSGLINAITVIFQYIVQHVLYTIVISENNYNFVVDTIGILYILLSLSPTEA
jgi:hypothetical protein